MSDRREPVKADTKSLHRGKERELWIDVLRVLAACAVVMMHTLTGAVDILNVSAYVSGTAMMIIMDVVSWCVPVFLMISGYLFLDPGRRISFTAMLHRYCLRIVLALLVFGVPFACLELVMVERTFRTAMLWESFLMVLTMQSWSHLWYLYCILLLYGLTPAMKWLLQRVPGWSVLLVQAVLLIGSCILPFINEIFGDGTVPKLPEQLFYLFYYLVGYCMHMRKIRVTAVPVAILAAGMVVYRLLDIPQIQMAYTYPPTVLLSLGIMYLARTVWERTAGNESRTAVAGNESRLQQGMMKFSGLSFGIYLVHPIFLNIFYKFLNLTPLNHAFLPALFGFFAVTLLGATGLSWLLHKIKPLRKYVL